MGAAAPSVRDTVEGCTPTQIEAYNAALVEARREGGVVVVDPVGGSCTVAKVHKAFGVKGQVGPNGGRVVDANCSRVAGMVAIESDAL